MPRQQRRNFCPATFNLKLVNSTASATTSLLTQAYDNGRIRATGGDQDAGERCGGAVFATSQVKTSWTHKDTQAFTFGLPWVLSPQAELEAPPQWQQKMRACTNYDAL